MIALQKLKKYEDFNHKPKRRCREDHDSHKPRGEFDTEGVQCLSRGYGFDPNVFDGMGRQPKQ